MNIIYWNIPKTIADKYGIECNITLEDYREDKDDEEYFLWDRWAFDLHEMIKEHILKIVTPV